MGQREVDDGRADPDPRCRGDHVGGEIKCVGADAVIEEVLFGKPNTVIAKLVGIPNSLELLGVNLRNRVSGR